MLAIFHGVGTLSEENDLSSNKHRVSAISPAHSFMSRGERRSGPGDLFGLKFLSARQTSYLLQWISDNITPMMLTYSGKLA